MLSALSSPDACSTWSYFYWPGWSGFSKLSRSTSRRATRTVHGSGKFRPLKTKPSESLKPKRPLDFPLETRRLLIDSINCLHGVLIFLVLIVWRQRIKRELSGRRILCFRGPASWSELRDDEQEQLAADDGEPLEKSGASLMGFCFCDRIFFSYLVSGREYAKYDLIIK